MKNIIAIALLSSVISMPAFAEDFYATLDIGRSKIADGCQDALGVGVSCSDTGTGLRSGIGYQVNPNFAVEGGYLNVSEAFKLTDTASFPGYTITATGKETALQLAVIGIYPINETLSVFAKAGLASVKTNISVSVTPPVLGGPISDSGTDKNLAWGLGTQFNMGEKLAMRVQYEDFGNVGTASSTTKNKFTLLSAGLVVKF